MIPNYIVFNFKFLLISSLLEISTFCTTGEATTSTHLNYVGYDSKEFVAYFQ